LVPQASGSVPCTVATWHQEAGRPVMMGALPLMLPLTVTKFPTGPEKALHLACCLLQLRAYEALAQTIGQ
jgi:hypothetical protein